MRKQNWHYPSHHGRNGGSRDEQQQLHLRRYQHPPLWVYPMNHPHYYSLKDHQILTNMIWMVEVEQAY